MQKFTLTIVIGRSSYRLTIHAHEMIIEPNGDRVFTAFDGSWIARIPGDTIVTCETD